MKQYAYMRAIAFFMNYLLVLTFLTSYFHWFDLSVQGFVLLTVLLVIPLLIAVLISTGDKVKEEDKDGKLPACHHEIMIGVWFLCIPSAIIEGQAANGGLCVALALLTLGIYFYSLFYNGKKQVLYNNPSVSENTRRTASRRMAHILARIGLVTALIVGVFILVVSVMPRMQLPKYQLNLFGNESAEEEREPQDVAESGRQSDVREKQKETANDNVFFLILRYVILALAILMTIVVICFALFKLIIYLAGRKRSDGLEYFEVEVEENDNEEYSKLIPIYRREVSFPKGNRGTVRKIFYKKICKKAREDKINPGLTPQELKEKYLGENSSEVYLTDLYEKARYSVTEITDDDLNQLHS